MADFKIEECGDAFDILSKSLYTNPDASCVREIVMNAVDATIEAGAQKQVKLTWNSAKEAFIVRDFGKGMTPAFVEELYTHYFSSTKKGSKNQTGMFGLGSKSPFAVTNKFWVTTVCDGKKYKWEMAKLPHQTPTATLVSTTDTIEPAGTEVEIPGISRGSVVNEVAKIMYQFDFAGFDSFDVKHMCENASFLDNVKSYPTVGDNRWSSMTFNILVGNYLFKDMSLPDSLTRKLTAKAEQAGVASYFNNATVFIRLNKGDVSFTPSRETFSFDEKTINGFEKVFDAMVAETVTINKGYEACKSFADYAAFATAYPGLIINESKLHNDVCKLLSVEEIVQMSSATKNGLQIFKRYTGRRFGIISISDLANMTPANTFNFFTFSQSINSTSTNPALPCAKAVWLLRTSVKGINNGFQYFIRKGQMVSSTAKHAAGPKKSGFFVSTTTIFSPNGTRTFYGQCISPETTTKEVAMKIASADKYSAQKNDYFQMFAKVYGQKIAVKWLCKDAKKLGAITEDEAAAKLKTFYKGKVIIDADRYHAKINVNECYKAYADKIAKMPEECKAWLKDSFGKAFDNLSKGAIYDLDKYVVVRSQKERTLLAGLPAYDDSEDDAAQEKYNQTSSLRMMCNFIASGFVDPVFYTMKADKAESLIMNIRRNSLSTIW